MGNLVQILILSVVEAVIIFKYIKFPLNILVFLILLVLEVGIVGYFFSPHRSPTLKAEFDRVAPYYDAVADAQKSLADSWDDKAVAAQRLETFQAKLSDLEKAFPNPSQDFQDRTCREWFLASLLKFQIYTKVATLLVEGKEYDQAKAAEISNQLKAADEKQKLQVSLVGLRVQSLEKSFFHSVLVGFLTWLRFATTST